MEKLLLLGGSEQQIVAIEAAKKLGLYTVVCDYLPDNPGQYHADRFYLVSTTDREAILQVAREEQVSGVIAYASDPAAPTAAYVAETLGLATNPLKGVETLCNKDRFRAFLLENGFETPHACGYSDTETVFNDLAHFRLPVIVKPVDSSGSKGATVLRDWDGLREAIGFALSFSRSKRYIVEEYIEKGYPYVIGGDVFVADGKVAVWGLMNCHRDPSVNPLVPVGKSFPTGLPAEQETAVRETVQRLITCIGYRNGPVNVELIVDRAGRVFPIDFGPRCGGNMIPVLMQNIFGIDVAELAVRGAMGMPVCITPHAPDACYATHNLHAKADGILQEIRYSDTIRQYLTDVHMYLQPGDAVSYFDNAAKAIGIVFFRFPDRAVMEELLSRINDHITVVVEPAPPQ